MNDWRGAGAWQKSKDTEREKELNQNQRGLKGWRDRRKNQSPDVSTPEHSFTFSLLLAYVFLKSLHSLLFTLFVSSSFFKLSFFNAAENMDVCPASPDDSLTDKLKLFVAQKAVFWIERQKMVGQQRVACVSQMFRYPPQHTPHTLHTSTHIRSPFLLSVLSQKRHNHSHSLQKLSCCDWFVLCVHAQ